MGYGQVGATGDPAGADALPVLDDVDGDALWREIVAGLADLPDEEAGPPQGSGRRPGSTAGAPSLHDAGAAPGHARKRALEAGPDAASLPALDGPGGNPWNDDFWNEVLADLEGLSGADVGAGSPWTWDAGMVPGGMAEAAALVGPSFPGASAGTPPQGSQAASAAIQTSRHAGQDVRPHLPGIAPGQINPTFHSMQGDPRGTAGGGSLTFESNRYTDEMARFVDDLIVASEIFRGTLNAATEEGRSPISVKYGSTHDVSWDAGTRTVTIAPGIRGIYTMQRSLLFELNNASRQKAFQAIVDAAQVPVPNVSRQEKADYRRMARDFAEDILRQEYGSARSVNEILHEASKNGMSVSNSSYTRLIDFHPEIAAGSRTLDIVGRDVKPIETFDEFIEQSKFRNSSIGDNNWAYYKEQFSVLQSLASRGIYVGSIKIKSPDWGRNSGFP